MNKISVKGLIVAVVVAVALDLAWSVALLVYISGGSADKTVVAAAVETYKQDNTYLAISLVLGMLTTVLGGYIVGRMAKTAKLFNAVLLGCIGLVFNAFTVADVPLWFNFLNFTLLVPAAIYGATLAVPKASASNA
jgi:hypothetical protein